MTRAAPSVACYQAGLAAQTLRLLAGDAARRPRAPTTCGTASSSPTAPTPTTTPTTPPRSTAASAPRRDDPVDNSWALMVYEPGFTAPAWAKDAVIYQIFPDRFRNGRANNDPQTGDVALRRPGARARRGARCPRATAATTRTPTTTCPWRFDATPPAEPDQGAAARPRLLRRRPEGRRPEARLPAGPRASTTIYFNPIFDAGSNHGYDTQDYTKIDPYFGTQKDWENLVKHAQDRGHPDHPRRRLQPPVVGQPVLRPLPPLRDGRRLRVGRARRSASWFFFHDVGAGHRHLRRRRRQRHGDYDGWFGFDSIPVLDKTAAERLGLEYFLTGAGRHRQALAAGRRRRLAARRRRATPSFPAGYWETFREVVKATSPDALTISETWQKDSTLLRDAPRRPLRHDDELPAPRRRPRLARARARSTRRASPTAAGIITPSEFLDRLSSIREDYPDAAYYSLMNLLDSHDTERLLWTLTPGRRHDRRQGAQRGQRGGRQGARPARLADPVHGARRADRLLRRRGRA